MTGSQITAVAITAISAWSVVSVVKKILDSRSKKLQREAENQRLKIQADAIAQSNEEANRDKQKTLECMIETLGIVSSTKPGGGDCRTIEPLSVH
jgi:hypothetical protein